MVLLSQQKLSVNNKEGTKVHYLIKEYADRVEFYRNYKYQEAVLDLKTLRCNCVMSKISSNHCIHVEIVKDMGIKKVTEGGFDIEL